ncbi:MAG: RagB/SusD family nutrient uptake outer membrane protein [Bacteroidales bacterium]
MKKQILIILLSAAILPWVYSCGDVLDINDTKSLSDDAIWSNETAADMYVTASYLTFKDISQVANSQKQYFDSYTDIMKSTSWDQYNHAYNKALLQSSVFSSGNAGPLACWTDVYTQRIKRANILLNEIATSGVDNFGAEWSDIRRAEVRLCRAFSYYRLIRVYGGVVLRTENSGENGGVDDGANPKDIHKKRLSEKESWDYVIGELQWAAQNLPDSWPQEWAGRATKKTAYGLLSRMALYTQQWQMAIDAAEQVKVLGGDLASDYAKLFQVDGAQDNSTEILLALYFQNGTVTHDYDRNMRPFGDVNIYKTQVRAEHVPTAELADLYEFSDGTPFDWNTYSSTHDDPYAEREPRFHATILYNGSMWEGRKIQTFVGGTDGYVDYSQSNSTGGHTCTGYYMKKYLQEGNLSFPEKGSYQTDVVLRYAEVLLNKAEAYAQLDYGANKTQALTALNEVRSRVGLPLRTEDDAPNLESFMQLLRKERCVELAGEGFRYWDLKRWKLAVDAINGKNAHGVKITASDGVYTYNTVEVDGGSPRIFQERYYYLSLPTAETNNNKECKNNPQW